MKEQKPQEKKILVARSSMPPMEEYVEMLGTLWESRWLTNMGSYHNELGRRLEEYLAVPNVSLFVNGHMALELCMQAMGLTGEVITTPFTFVSTTHAIIRNGLTPVFCDIREDDYTLDASKLEGLITEKTSAIVPVHVYGNLCDAEAIGRIADKYGLKVIYDAAHAFGETKDGVGVGNFGDASMFSFHATKVFHTIEGGAVCTADEKLVRELYKLKDFGIRDEETIDGVGSNGKMNEFAAIMGLCNLRHLEGEIEKRRLVAVHYRERLQGVPGLKLNPEEAEGVQSNYAYFPVVIDEEAFGESRDALALRLKERGIFVRKYFYPLTSSLSCFDGRFRVEETPVALRMSMGVLTLPMYADLTISDVDRICDAILER